MYSCMKMHAQCALIPCPSGTRHEYPPCDSMCLSFQSTLGLDVSVACQNDNASLRSYLFLQPCKPHLGLLPVHPSLGFHSSSGHASLGLPGTDLATLRNTSIDHFL